MQRHGRNLAWMALLIAGVSASTGCVVAAVGAVAGGAIYYVNNHAIVDVDATPDELKAATYRVFERMGIEPTDDGTHNNTHHLKGRSADGRAITVLYKIRDAGGTAVQVRAGLVGDKHYAVALIQRIVEESGAANISEARSVRVPDQPVEPGPSAGATD